MKLNITFSKDEIKDIFISTLVLGFIIGLSFIPHELAHKLVAMYYGHFARYVMWKEGLFFALLLSGITRGELIFAAPGAVWIIPRSNFGYLSAREDAIISAAGPLMNLVTAILAIILVGIYPSDILVIIYYINTLLAFFNLLPLPPLDGSHIARSNLLLWIVMICFAGILFFIF